METSKDIKRVFTGSAVEATFIKEILEESGIGAMIRDTMEESLAAGWVSGSQEDSCLVFVASEHYEQAVDLVNKFNDSQIV